MITIDRLIILCCISLLFFGTKKSIAQDIIIVMEVNENHTPNFHLEGVSPDRVVWFFGDGHYSFMMNPSHNFNNNEITTENITAYHMTRYIPLPPTLTDNFYHNDAGNNFINPSYYTEITESIGVDVSAMWDPVIGEEIIYTTLLTNNETETFDGSLEFKFPSELLDLHPNFFSEGINNEDWFSFDEVVDNVGENTSSIFFSVNSITPGDQHLLHLRFKVSSTTTLFEDITTQALLTTKRGEKFKSSSIKKVKGAPHDPNYKWRDKKMICINSANSKFIEYELHFQNMGNGFAEDIGIHDFYSDLNLIKEYEILDYSIAPTSHGKTNDMIFFEFENAMLPGSNQNYPVQYSFEQSQGFIKYRIKTKPCLFQYNTEQLITSANILFDDELPVSTNEVVTEINGKCLGEPKCSISDREAYNRSSRSDDQGILSINVFPNPHKTNLNISFDGNTFLGETTIVIYDALGRQMEHLKKEILYSGKTFIQLDTKNWNPGVHLISIQNGTFRKSLRCIKQD